MNQQISSVTFQEDSSNAIRRSTKNGGRNGQKDVIPRSLNPDSAIDSNRRHNAEFTALTAMDIESHSKMLKSNFSLVAGNISSNLDIDCNRILNDESERSRIFSSRTADMEYWAQDAQNVQIKIEIGLWGAKLPLPQAEEGMSGSTRFNLNGTGMRYNEDSSLVETTKQVHLGREDKILQKGSFGSPHEWPPDNYGWFTSGMHSN